MQLNYVYFTGWDCVQSVLCVCTEGKECAVESSIYLIRPSINKKKKKRKSKIAHPNYISHLFLVYVI